MSNFFFFNEQDKDNRQFLKYHMHNYNLINDKYFNENLSYIFEEYAIILYGKKRQHHQTGHSAILIGTDSSGWYYYSMDGGDSNTSDRHTIMYFNSFNEFVNSEHNTFKHNYDDKEGKKSSEKDKNGIIIQRYTSAYKIPISYKQATKMRSAAKQYTHENYNELNWTMFGNNCTENVRQALDAGGLKNGEYATDDDIWTIVPNFTPLAKYRYIVLENSGEDISDLLKINNED
ncbi:hypothetical protein [Myroides marinus]|uniref:hypothetical protein n=1 Tax=Myroides marinus TaxID=703342 RepID=UPI002576025A|nr:hypothetical protein [Myroides marinus]MDM1346902.1 hypothetical protein [Myroides marinus]